MMEFLQNVIGLETVFRHSLPDQPVHVKRTDHLPEFSDYGMMRIVAIIIHKDEPVTFGFTPADSTDPDDIHYYSVDQVELTWDVGHKQANEIMETYGQNVTFVNPSDAARLKSMGHEIKPFSPLTFTQKRKLKKSKRAH